jgi:hypothetical protein
MMRLFPLIALIALAACADSEPPDAVPANDNGAYNLVEQVSVPLADDAQPTLGQWMEAMQEEQPALQFGAPNTEPLFSLRCGEGGGILLNRHGIVAQGGADTMVVTIGADAQRLPVAAVPGPLPMLRATAPAGDPLLARLGGAKDTIRIAIGDSPELTLRASPLIAQFIGDCGAPDAAPPPASNSVASNAQ